MVYFCKSPTVTVSATDAGLAVVSAVGQGFSNPSTQVTIDFSANCPNLILLQVSPSTVGVNAPGSTVQQSTITAIVLDAAFNLVENQTVNFSLLDTTGGSISPAAALTGTALTSNFGRASTVYTAGLVASRENGVMITASINSVVPSCNAVLPVTRQGALTVAQQALFVRLGTANQVQNGQSITQYALPYSVLVTDVNGNPVGNAMVDLTVLPTLPAEGFAYQKGQYIISTCDPSASGCLWVKSDSFLIQTPCVIGGPSRIIPIISCNNEDVNSNGILDPGEDFNSNGILDPGNVATPVPSRVTTDATGFGFFNVVYAKQFATWVTVDVQARTVVAGTEALSRATFPLPALLSDFVCSVFPPAQFSPFGICTSNATCPSGIAPPNPCTSAQ